MSTEPAPEPMTAEEVATERRRHSGQPQCRSCMQPQPCLPSRMLATIRATPSSVTPDLRAALGKIDFDRIEVHVGPEYRVFDPPKFAEWLVAALASVTPSEPTPHEHRPRPDRQVIQEMRNHRNLLHRIVRTFGERSPEGARSHIEMWCRAAIEDIDALMSSREGDVLTDVVE